MKPSARRIAVLSLALAVCSVAAAQTDAVRQASERLIKTNDKNDDGKLSRDEFPERIRPMFDRVDADKDGFVSLEEDLAYRKSREPRQARQARLPEGAKVERDLVYSQVGERRLLLDLYLPPKGAAPVIVWIHGGGWRGGSKGSGGRALPLLERGYAVVDVGYRLSGEAIFPAQVEDCKAAVRWLRANAAKYNLDPDRFGAWGSSAGGHLVAFLGTTGDVKEFDTKTNAKFSSRVQAVCNWFGPSDLLQMDKQMLEGSKLVHDAADSPESLLVGGPIQKEPYRSLAIKVNPITYVTKDDPPFLNVHGDKDMLVPHHQSELLHAALRKAGVDSTLRIVKGAGHGLRGGELSSEELLELAAGFFDKHLKAKRSQKPPR